jgi:hypothetical protein
MTEMPGVIREFRQSKDKSIALIFAILSGPWTWLYTYHVDSWKFWINIGLTVVTLGFWAPIGWIWAMVDTASRPREFFATDPSVNEINPLSGATSIHDFKTNTVLNRIRIAQRRIQRDQKFVRILSFVASFLTFVFSTCLVIILTGGCSIAVLVGAGWGNDAGVAYGSWFGLGSGPGLSIFGYWRFRIPSRIHRAITRKRETRTARLEADLDSHISRLEDVAPDFVSEFGGRDVIREFIR